jgi:hypothetical protein
MADEAGHRREGVVVKKRPAKTLVEINCHRGWLEMAAAVFKQMTPEEQKALVGKAVEKAAVEAEERVKPYTQRRCNNGLGCFVCRTGQ